MKNSVQQAIVTKYLSPTDVRGARIKAFCDGGSITIDYDHSLSSEDAHRKAAEALRERMHWTGELIQGGLPKGYVFTFMPKIVAYRCQVCGMTGTDHDYETTWGVKGHRFVCGEPIYQ